MRGIDQQQSHMFSYLSPEARVRKDHPLRAMRTMVDEVLRALSPRFDRMYARGPAVDCAGEAVAGAVAADAVLDSQRAAADGRDRLQHAVPLVRRAEHGRRGVGCDRVHQESRPAAGGRSGQGVFGAGGGAGAGARLDSDEHFTVDGTLLEAWAGAKSFQRRMARSRRLATIPAIRR